MKIYGLEKLSLVDYDGFVAATVFTGSCNFRCPFCHNASLIVDYDKLPPIDENEVFSYLKKRKGIIEGLCITGGEPTLNKDLPEFCEKAKQTGVFVKVDSNGTSPQTIKLLAENGLADYFAIDIKNDRKNYAKIVGLNSFDTKNIEKTVSYLIGSKVGYEFRTTLIDEFHSEENIIEIGKWISGAKKYFLQKFKSGENCLLPDGLNPVSDENAKRFLTAVAPFVKFTKLRGYDLSG